MYFVWFWEQTAINSLCTINWLVLITEIRPFTAQWSLYVPHNGHYMYRQFNIQQFYVLLHTVFMCFVWIWEQTAIISLYSINWLVFITETECVYCAVWTGYLYIIEANFTVWRADNSAHPISCHNFPINDHSYELRYVPQTYLHTYAVRKQKLEGTKLARVSVT